MVASIKKDRMRIQGLIKVFSVEMKGVGREYRNLGSIKLPEVSKAKFKDHQEPCYYIERSSVFYKIYKGTKVAVHHEALTVK